MNTKVFLSDERIILRVYPFEIDNENQNHKKERSVKKNKTDVKHAKINLQNKYIKLLGYGLCNKWQYFFTGTIDPQRFDASDYENVSFLISKEFKALKRVDPEFQYCYILERHQNGNYHAHGFININGAYVTPFPTYVRPASKKPVVPSKSKFIQYGIKQAWYDLGLNTLSPIHDLNNVADYCGKYMTKSIASGEYYSKSIFKSHGLKSFQIEYGDSNLLASFNCFNDGKISSDHLSINNIYNIEHKRSDFNNYTQIQIKI